MREYKSIVVGWICAALFAALLYLPAIAGDHGDSWKWYSGEIHVDAKGIYGVRTIVNAVARASAGDVITIHPGTYTETGIISKNVTIEGVDNERCILTGGSELWTGGADGFVIKNMTILGTTSDTLFDPGAYEYDFFNCVVAGSTIVVGTDTVLWEDCQINVLQENGMSVSTAWWDAINCTWGYDNAVGYYGPRILSGEIKMRNCYVWADSTALDIKGAEATTTTVQAWDCVFKTKDPEEDNESTNTVDLDNISYLIAERCSFYNYTPGSAAIYWDDSSRVRLSKCTVSNTAGSDSWAMDARTQGSSVIYSCDLDGGIKIDTCNVADEVSDNNGTTVFGGFFASNVDPPVLDLNLLNDVTKPLVRYYNGTDGTYGASFASYFQMGPQPNITDPYGIVFVDTMGTTHNKAGGIRFDSYVVLEMLTDTLQYDGGSAPAP
jgi:hypothetical protein